MASRVLPDANVLHSRTLRDWLLMLMLEPSTELFSVFYTEDILAEVIATIRRRRPDLDGGAMTSLHDRIVATMTGRIAEYSGLAEAPVVDPKDRHVHAAAVSGGISYLITHDSDFTRLPPTVTEGLPYEIHTPDSFFVTVDDWSSMSVRAVTREQHAYWTSRGSSDLPGALRKAGCPRFADRVAGHLRALFT